MAAGTLWSREPNTIITDRNISWGEPNPEDSIVKLTLNKAHKLARIEAKDYAYGGGPIDHVICNLNSY
jgi:hypothetical protein